MSNSSHDRCNTCTHRDDRAQKAANAAEGRPLGTLPANIAKEALRQATGQDRIESGFIQLGIPLERYQKMEKEYMLPYINLIRSAPEEQQVVTLSRIRREGSMFGLLERDGHLRNGDGSRAFPNRDETMDSLDMQDETHRAGFLAPDPLWPYKARHSEKPFGRRRFG
jgi:hypothetical protein